MKRGASVLIYVCGGARACLSLTESLEKPDILS